jgi:cytochrome b6-f complex iron-sulfur subunit
MNDVATQPRRRGFLGWLAGSAAALVFFKAGVARAKKFAVGLDKAAAIKENGQSVKLKLKEQPVLFVRSKEGTLHAIDPTCTHKKCQIDYSNETDHLHCKCHKSAYTLDGKVLGGPAPKPLTVFKASIDGERIIVELPDPEEKKE